MAHPLSLEARHQFRQRLRHEFALRCARNPRYSLRAFARWLRVDHSTLAALIRGTRPVTPALVIRLAVRLGCDASEVERYLQGQAAVAPPPFPSLADAILGVIGRVDFRPDTRWISRMIGVSVDEVVATLPDLLRTNQLAMVARRRWVVRTPAQHQVQPSS